MPNLQESRPSEPAVRSVDVRVREIQSSRRWALPPTTPILRVPHEVTALDGPADVKGEEALLPVHGHDGPPMVGRVRGGELGTTAVGERVLVAHLPEWEGGPGWWMVEVEDVLGDDWS